jgi:hypothetical protein
MSCGSPKRVHSVGWSSAGAPSLGHLVNGHDDEQAGGGVRLGPNSTTPERSGHRSAVSSDSFARAGRKEGGRVTSGTGQARLILIARARGGARIDARFDSGLFEEARSFQTI